MPRERVAALVEAAARKAIAEGALPDVALPAVALERPRDAAHGDYASSLPLRLARAAVLAP